MDPLPDRIEVELIKGIVPNYITARAEIAALKEREVAQAEAEGRDPREVVYCQYCGEKMKNKKTVNIHLRYCKRRKMGGEAQKDGVAFAVGETTFLVRTDRIKILIGLEQQEAEAGRKLAAGIWDRKNALLAFQKLLTGTILARAEGTLTYEVIPPGKEPRSAVSGGDMSPPAQNAGADGGTVADPVGVVGEGQGYSQE